MGVTSTVATVVVMVGATAVVMVGATAAVMVGAVGATGASSFLSAMVKNG